MAIKGTKNRTNYNEFNFNLADILSSTPDVLLNFGSNVELGGDYQLPLRLSQQRGEHFL